MQNYIVTLDAEVSKSFRAIKAAQSVNLDAEKKARHSLSVSVDTVAPFNIGLVVGASGSGKTTLIKKIYGEDCFEIAKDLSKSIIDQLPEEMSYDECAILLSSVGLTSIPCWVTPMYTLSNGQRARAEIALAIANTPADGIIVLDEWTSVVNREVAKVMSHSLQKYARKSGRKFILCSCHFDVIEWLNPDWIVDCNSQSYENRRDMVSTFKRTDQLRLGIKEVDRATWKVFSRYHYLSDKLPGGKIYCFGLFLGDDQIGFGSYANYSPIFRNMISSNRVVVHPDYIGLGLGIKFVTETSRILHNKGYDVRATLSSPAMIKARDGHPNWKLTNTKIDFKKKDVRIPRSQMGDKDAAREWISRNNKCRVQVRVASYKFVP